MTPRTLLNLVLLLVVLTLVTVVVFEPGKTPEPKIVLLTDLKNSDINNIKIVRKDKGSIELEKKSGHWQMLAPYVLPANDYKVESIMKLLGTESTTQYDMNKLDPARFDLVTPAVSVILNNSLRIEFGNLEPLQKQRYVRIGQQLHLIPDYYYYQLIGSITDYLDHALIVEGEKITRIELPDLTLALTEGKWILSPKNEGYSADAYTDLLNEWQHAHAVELRPLTEAKNPGKTQVHIFLQNSESPINFSLHQTEDEFILTRADKNIEYVMAADKAEMLLKLQKQIPVTEKTGEQN